MALRLFKWVDTYLYYPIIAPLFFFILELIIPKKKGSIVISLPRGRDYSDNSRYFFEYCAEETNVTVRLLTKKYSLYQELTKKYPGKILYSFSFEGLWTFLRADILFMTHNKYDVHPYVPLGVRKNIINLWHGTPLKRVNYLHKKSSPYYINNMGFCNFLCSSSEFTKYLMSTQFRIHPDDVWITGQPRNDALFADNSVFVEKHPFLKKRTILYAPTFRLDDNVKLFPFPDFDLAALEMFLEKTDTYLLIRCHYIEWKSFQTAIATQQKIGVIERIKMADFESFPCVAELLRNTDILITDYSSLYFDYLLLNKPIIFLPYDLEDYENKRGLNVNYHDNTPGPKPQTYTEFIQHLEVYFNKPATDENVRIKIRNKYNKYIDGNASQRIISKLDESNIIHSL